MAEGGVDHLFFTSGTEIVWYQEAIAKAKAHGRAAPRLITMTHEHASLNAALGYAAVSGKPVATAVHVDAGTYNYGGAIHTAAHAGLPVMITAGTPPVAYPGSMRGARDRGGHLWMQQTFDQNGIVRNYVKWDHRLEYQDNPGLMASRALQVALTEPRGPVYFSVPREISLLAGARHVVPDGGAAGHSAPGGRRSGRHPRDRAAAAGRRTALPRRVEFGPRPAHDGAARDAVRTARAAGRRLGLPRLRLLPDDAPAEPRLDAPRRRRRVLVLEANVPWVPGPAAPPKSAYIAVIDPDPIRQNIPTFEFTADLRLRAGSLGAIEALTAAVRATITDADRTRIAARRERYDEAHVARLAELERDAQSRSKKTPIDPVWLSHEIGVWAGEDSIVFDETIAHNKTVKYLKCSQPGSFIANPASSGGYTPGAAFGGEAGGAGQARRRDHRRRLLHVQHGQRGAVGRPRTTRRRSRSSSSKTAPTARAPCKSARRIRTRIRPRSATTAERSTRRWTSPKKPKAPAPTAKTSATRPKSCPPCSAPAKPTKPGIPAVVSVWVEPLF